MTAAKANNIRADRIEGRRESMREKREAEKATKLAESGKYTLSCLWDEYESQKTDSKALRTDKGRFLKHLKPPLGDKEPYEIICLDVDRLRVNLSKKLKPKTVKNILG